MGRGRIIVRFKKSHGYTRETSRNSYFEVIVHLNGWEGPSQLDALVVIGSAYPLSR